MAVEDKYISMETVVSTTATEIEIVSSYVELSNWILATGFWDDEGVWDDNETWND